MGSKESRLEPKTYGLTSKQVKMLAATTQFSEEEIRQWHKSFLRDCPEGRLNRKKFTETYQKLYPSGKADEFCRYAFDTFDKNHDGTIDFNEFLVVISINTQGTLDDRLELAFEMYDISNDGQIEERELIKIITAIYDLVGETERCGEREPKRRAAEIIQKMDISGDQKISKAEFIAGCKNDPIIRRLLVPNT